MKNFQDNELSHLPYNKLWVDHSDIIVWNSPTDINGPHRKKITLNMGLLLNMGLYPEGSWVSKGAARMVLVPPAVHSPGCPPREVELPTLGKICLQQLQPQPFWSSLHLQQGTHPNNTLPRSQPKLAIPDITVIYSWKTIYGTSFTCSALHMTNIVHEPPKLAWKTC